MIAILPVGMNYRTERLPIVTLSIIGLNTLVYLVSLVCALNTEATPIHGFMIISTAEAIEPPTSNPQPMRVSLPPRPTVSAPETPTIFLHDGTQQSGPFTLSQVQAMLQCGSIAHETQYWSEGLDNWQNVMELSSKPGG